MKFDWNKWNSLKARWEDNNNIRVGYFYDSPSPWVGGGDLLYNTARQIIVNGDKDRWADISLERIFKTLEEGKRWPDYMTRHIPISKTGDQCHMTQDPWIMAYCCAVHLNRYDLIEKHKPSFWRLPIFFDKYSWRRKLLGKPNMYWLIEKLTPYFIMQWFVYVFYGYMKLAIITKTEQQ